MTTYTVSSGVTQLGLVLSAGDMDVVLSGGLAISTGVGVGAEQIVSAGGSAALVNVDGHEAVAGGTLISATIDSGGSVDVFSGGMTELTFVDAGGFETAVNGGTLEGSTVAGTQLVSAGGSAMGTLLSGEQDVYAGGTSISAQVEAGGSQIVQSGGVASATTVFGSETVASGGIADNTNVAGGGFVFVQGGTLTGTTVQALGEIDVSAGLVRNTLLSGVESLVGKTSEARAQNTAVASGGVQYVGGFAVASASLIGQGGIQFVDHGGIAVRTVINSGGVVEVNGATGSTGSGATGGVASATTVVGGGTLVVLGASAFTSPEEAIPQTRLLEGGTIDLTTVAYASAETASIDGATDLLTISGGGTDVTVQLLGSYAGEYFHLAGDGGSGVDITVDGTPCYCRGTLILTDAGEVAVEDLAIGDRLITVSGQARTLRWIGRRRYAGRFAAGNPTIMPVTIRAGALADGVPRRDLAVSPLHALFIDGVLIPAAALVDGRAVVQAQAVDEVCYFHLELDCHDVLLAEGTPAESFVDDASRGMFHNAADFAARYPDATPRKAVYCAPRVEDGPVVAAVRRRIAERLRAVPAATCRGYLDQARRDMIIGWAVDAAAPEHRVRVRVCANGVALGETVADRPRDDLRAAGIGDGRHGFALSVPGGLCPSMRHVITAETLDGVALQGALVLEPVGVIEQGPGAPPRTDVEVEAVAMLRGHVDVVARDRVLGWAIDDADPARPVGVQVVVNGVLAASVLANRHRRDVAEAGIGDGRHAFEHHFDPPLSPLQVQVVEVRAEADGSLLGARVSLEPSGRFDAALEDVVSRAVDGLDASERDRVLNFMLAQAGRLRQHQADASAGRVMRARDRLASRAGRAVSDARPRALVIDAELPDPARDAGSHAILSHMRALQRLGYDVSFVAAEALAAPADGLPGALPGQAAPCEALVEMGVSVCAAPVYASVEDVLRRQQGCFDLVYLHRAPIAQAYLALARRWMGAARLVYAVADLHHVRLERQALAEDRPELMAVSQRMRLAECTAAWSADVVLTHSPHEAALLRRLVPRAEVHVVPWEVACQKVTLPFEARHGLAFVGNYAHGPNVAAAQYLVEAVMPLVWAEDAGIICHLAGHGMTPRMRALAQPGVVMGGHVPVLGSLFGRVRLTVAPLLAGAGIKGKVLDSLAAGLPCAMSPVAAEGLVLPPSLAACVGVDAAALAGIILRLHEDGATNGRASQAGLELIRTTNSGERVETALAAALAMDHRVAATS